MLRTDYHLHTNFSDDSKSVMEDVVLKALELGLNEICITDHVEYKTFSKVSVSQVIDYPTYFTEIQRLNEKYGDKVVIKAGAEFGAQMHTLDDYKHDFEKHTFDFILLSSHQINNVPISYQEFQDEKTQEQVNWTYYENFLDLVKKYDNFSVVGHLDIIKRYDKRGVFNNLKTESLIQEILEILIRKGKGIEVNSSNFRYGFIDPSPSWDIIEQYYRLGGRIITIGSDAHWVKDVGLYHDEVISKLKIIGFDAICTYDKMVPIFHKI